MTLEYQKEQLYILNKIKAQGGGIAAVRKEEQNYKIGNKVVIHFLT